MNKKIILILAMGLILIKCNIISNQLKSNGNYEVAIQNAILDFSRTHLYRKGAVFKVGIGYPNDNIILITIIEDEENKYLYSKTKAIEENILPSRYFEKENKLFIWWDNEYRINQEMYNILEKYNMLKDDEDGWITMLDSSIDDMKKSADYYFCKEDLKKYKRFISNYVLTEIPNLKCK